MGRSITIGLILLLTVCISCGEDILVTQQQQELAIVEIQPIITKAPYIPQEIYTKGCWVDDDCNDGVWCTGREWCCNQAALDYGIQCNEGKCYTGVSPCGQPVASVLAVCDCLWDYPCNDTCRGCYDDIECDDNFFCNGRERCGTEAEGHHWGLCLHVPGSHPCKPDEYCYAEEQRCGEPPECRRDSDCPGLEAWCDENGKCQDG